MNLTDTQKAIIDILSKDANGKANTKNNEFLCQKLKEATGLVLNERQMRDEIQSLRLLKCYPICSQNRGYFWGNLQELREYIEQFRERIESEQRTENALFECYKKMKNQNQTPQSQTKLFPNE